MRELDRFYELQEEPNRSCYLAIRLWISSSFPEMSEEWKYGLPFFYYQSKPFCYLWKDKKTSQPYIGFARGHLIDHPHLFKGNRKKMKVLPICADQDLPIDVLTEIFSALIPLYF